MYLLLTDETNKNPDANVKFFAYGGIFFPIAKLKVLHDGITKIRNEAGYTSEQEFKFDTRSRPSSVTQETFTNAKKMTVDLCLGNDVKFIVHLIHHGIIRNQNQAEQITKAADYVIGRFNYFLSQNDQQGICIIDNVPINEQFSYLSKKFQQGLNLPDDGRSVSLDRILLYGASAINASHANSAMDIILGSFRYCVNNPRNPEAASEMMKKIVSMMWAKKVGSTTVYRDYGFILRPPLDTVRERFSYFYEEYNGMIGHLNSLLD